MIAERSERARRKAAGAPGSTYFMFATGIENSSPTVGARRVDQMESCGHYRLFREDFALTADLGIGYLRYGPALYRTFIAAGRYDWSFADEAFAELLRLNITPIVDLCHFGVPDFIGDFQNPDFPELLAAYARAFAIRYPWVQLYTPVNEMYICALFSAKYGWWNERRSDDRSFVTALKHIVRANVLAMQAILDVRPDAIFVQSESTEYFHAKRPGAIRDAEFLNEIRFLSLDLNYSHPVSAEMYEFLRDNGMTRDEYHFFNSHDMRHHCIMGNDYYATNEHFVSNRHEITTSGEIFGYAPITKQYFERYRLPIMHTETNVKAGGEEAVRWLCKEWANVLRVRNDGFPIVGFTWYSLTDQIDWDSLLLEDNGNVNPLGLYDLERRLRPVGAAYRELIADWQELLPTQSLVLSLPLFPPNLQNDPLVRSIRNDAQDFRTAASAEENSLM